MPPRTPAAADAFRAAVVPADRADVVGSGSRCPTAETHRWWWRPASTTSSWRWCWLVLAAAQRRGRGRLGVGQACLLLAGAHDVRAISGRRDQDCAGHDVDVQREAGCPAQRAQQRAGGDPADGVGSGHVEQHAIATAGGGRGQCRQGRRLRRCDRQWGRYERLDELLVGPTMARAAATHLCPRQRGCRGVSAGGSDSEGAVRTDGQGGIEDPTKGVDLAWISTRTGVRGVIDTVTPPSLCTDDDIMIDCGR